MLKPVLALAAGLALSFTALAAQAADEPLPAEEAFRASARLIDDKQVEIRFRVPKPPAFVRPDMTISVETVTGRQASTLQLPTEAVREPDGGKPWVLVANGGTAQRREVRVGLAGIGKVEIIEGLAEGDQAILPASGALDGDKVRVRPPKPARVGGLQVPPRMTK